MRKRIKPTIVDQAIANKWEICSIIFIIFTFQNKLWLIPLFPGMSLECYPL